MVALCIFKLGNYGLYIIISTGILLVVRKFSGSRRPSANKLSRYYVVSGDLCPVY